MPSPNQYHHHHFTPSSLIASPSSPSSGSSIGGHSRPKMTAGSKTFAPDHDGGIRKRVCKACDRCRLKKSKCDGFSPCSRCKADNAICVFGERKKSQDKVYPKGYVEMLEQQQGQLVEGLQEMYHRLRTAEAWSGPALAESGGHPLTHDILMALNLLEMKTDGSGELEVFEDDCSRLQERLLANGAGFVQRRSSFSSDSDHSHQDVAPPPPRQPARKRGSMAGKISPGQQPAVRDTFTFGHSPSHSVPQSPQTQQAAPTLAHLCVQVARSTPTSVDMTTASMSNVSTPQDYGDSPLIHDQPMYQAKWMYEQQINNSKYTLPTGTFYEDNNKMADMEGVFEPNPFEEMMAFEGLHSNAMTLTGSNGDFGYDPMMDFDLNKYVAVQ